MTEQYEKKSTWLRILFVALFWVVFNLSQFVLFAIVIGQCLFKIFTGKPNLPLMNLGKSVSQYVSEILTYVTFNSDKRPFPFDDFPKAGNIIEGEKV